jgi:DNA-binding CsgD family transcriptional regulator
LRTGIAEALFVSRNTVKTHLRSVYVKLGVSGRAALATEVADHTR